jgi:dephospho-CoA kinase
MRILGLTGSIGMGKSTAAEHFRARGIGVFDADAMVHKLYADAAVPLIEAAFPGTTAQGQVDRAKLSASLGASQEAFARLEAIIHPLVAGCERDFLAAEHAKGVKFAVLEIPLLFETGGNLKVDTVVVLTTDAATQRARVMARPGMTAERLDAILARQMGDREKRARADFVVDTSGPVADTRAQIDQVLEALDATPGTAFQRFWIA